MATSGAALASAVASVISATSALGASTVAILALRKRRPKLRVEVSVGNPHHGSLAPEPDGVATSVRVTNVRDSDVQVINLWFEPDRSIGRRLRKQPAQQSLVPPTAWFMKDAGMIPGTVKAHHTELYAFRTENLRPAFAHGGAPRYRPVIEIAGGRCNYGNWMDVEVIEAS